MWIDSHCHLNHSRNEGCTPEALISDFADHDIGGCVTINCRISDEFDEVLSIARAHNNVWCTVGTHPHDAGATEEQAISEDELVRLAQSDPNILGIGESGLDYFYEHSPRDLQEASFRKHIRACTRTGLPLIVHTREAEEDTIRIIEDEMAGGVGELRGVLHCFSSAEHLAMRALEWGFYVSFSGIVTFKKSTELQEVAKKIPQDRILVETDAPFLAPVPHRGKMNRPSYVHYTGEFLADLLDVPVDKFADKTTENFFRLFDRAKLS
ncbi:MAG: TatD family hydrolase [Alphaproteobacteria bacterium]